MPSAQAPLPAVSGVGSPGPQVGTFPGASIGGARLSIRQPPKLGRGSGQMGHLSCLHILATYLQGICGAPPWLLSSVCPPLSLSQQKGTPQLDIQRHLGAPQRSPRLSCSPNLPGCFPPLPSTPTWQQPGLRPGHRHSLLTSVAALSLSLPLLHPGTPQSEPFPHWEEGCEGRRS